MSTTATQLQPNVLQRHELPSVRPSGRFGDVVFANLTRLAAVITLLLLVAIIVSLVFGAMPSIREFGLPFLWTAEWDPVQNKFGGLVMIYGTVATSVIALIIAVPVSFGIALFLTELSPKWLKRPLGTAIDTGTIRRGYGCGVSVCTDSGGTAAALQIARQVPISGVVVGALRELDLSAGSILAIMIIP